MTNLKKFFVPAVALLLALTVGNGVAQAQVTVPRCSVTATNNDLRAEGMTEMLGDITIACRSGGASFQYPAQDDYKIDVQVTNANITNTIYSSDTPVASEITLIMWEVLNGDVPDRFNLDDTNTDGIDEDAQTANARVINDNTIQFSINRQQGSAVNQPLNFRISGIRVDASNASSSSVNVTVRSRTIDFDLAGSTTDTAGSVKTGLKSSISTAIEGVTCAASKGIGNNDLRDNMDDANLARVKVEENLNNAFQMNDSLMLTFSDVPEGVRVYLRPGDKGGDGDDGNDGTGAEGAANDLEGSDTLVLQLVPDATSTSGRPSASEDYEFAEVSISGGSGTAYYRVTGMDAVEKESKIIPVYFRRDAGAGTGMGMVSVSYAPTSTVGVASLEAVPVPRFSRTVKPMTVLTLQECSTTLLFPFVTNQANHDTGIAISNTSMDAFGTDETEGTCRIYYYGNAAGEGNMMPDEDMSSMVGAGEQLIFSLSAGNPSMGISAAEGFQGYLMARCGFRFAHGLAFITNNFGIGTPSLAHGYLALVVDVDFDDRSLTDDRESLNH